MVLMANADPDAGQALTRACTTCHTFDQGGANGVGPNNWDIVGQDVAHIEGFGYSQTLEAMHETGVTWTYENLNRFLYQPREWAPGTTMKLVEDIVYTVIDPRIDFEARRV